MKYRITSQLSGYNDRQRFFLEQRRWWFPFWGFVSSFDTAEEARKAVEILKKPPEYL